MPVQPSSNGQLPEFARSSRRGLSPGALTELMSR